MKISIIICTYNRSHLLRLCLKSLLEQTIDSFEFEVIVVDNNSIDDTKVIAAEFVKSFQHFQYIFEPNTGLSFARNTGYQYATSDWILYLDDDAKAFPNMVERAIYTTKKYHFPCFGGIIISYFNKNDKIPRWWITDRFECNEYLLKTFNGVCTLDKESPYGGIIVIKKELLIDLGGFKTNIGMQGNKIGYGEETDFVHRIRQNNIAIGIDTEVRIYHLVSSNKLKFSWHLKAAFAKGYSSLYISNTVSEENNFSSIKYFLLSPIRYFKIIGYAVKSVIINPKFYVGNSILSILSVLYFDWGKIRAIVDKKKENCLIKPQNSEI